MCIRDSYNLTRELGGALGLASLGTIMNERLHFHWSRLIEDVNTARPAIQHFLDVQTDRLGGLITGDPGHAALKLLAGKVQREALVLTYNDALILIGILFVLALLLIPLVKNPRATPFTPDH